MSAIYSIIKVNGLIYPVVDELGVLSYHGFNGGSGKHYFTGSFSSNEVNIRYYGNGALGQAARESHTIQGIKINKK
jgi:hypothetical protein